MKRKIIQTIKHFIPYKVLPPRLKKIVAQFAHTSKATNTSALPNMNHVLNCLIAYNKYGGYCIPLSSHQRPVVQQVLKGRVHEEDTIEFIRKNCGTGDVVHAGTYFGDFLPAISEAMAPNATVWAFEPNAENFKCAQVTIILNDLKNVVIKNSGLGKAEAVQKLLVQTSDGTNLGGTSRIANPAEGGQTVSIDIVSIDETIPKDRHLSVIQLDVEGYEKEVLSGALETIKRCKPAIVFEINNIDLTKSDWLAENILSLGYEVSGRVHMNSVLKYTGA